MKFRIPRRCILQYTDPLSTYNVPPTDRHQERVQQQYKSRRRSSAAGRTAGTTPTMAFGGHGNIGGQGGMPFDDEEEVGSEGSLGGEPFEQVTTRPSPFRRFSRYQGSGDL